MDLLEALTLLSEAGISGAEAGKNLRRIVMNDRERMIIGRDMIRVYESLLDALEAAGGGRIGVREMESMSVLDLLGLLAPNKVRFYCNKTHACVILGEEKIHGSVMKIDKNSS